MSCDWCQHWTADRDSNGGRNGECRRYPQVVRTNCNYHCGENLPKQGLGSEKSLLDLFDEQRRDYLADYQNERAERIRMGKELKRIRAIFRKAGLKS